MSLIALIELHAQVDRLDDGSVEGWQDEAGGIPALTNSGRWQRGF
jgi:hypothetical protein